MIGLHLIFLRAPSKTYNKLNFQFCMDSLLIILYYMILFHLPFQSLIKPPIKSIENKYLYAKKNASNLYFRAFLVKKN